MQHQAQIQKQRLFFGVDAVAPQKRKDLLRNGKPGLFRVQKHGLPVKKAALDLIGLDRHIAHARDDLQRLPDFGLQREVLGVFVVGVKRQHAARQLVHNVGGGRFEHHVLKKALRPEQVKLLFIGQDAEDQEIDHLFKAEAPLGLAVVHQIPHVIAAVVERALHRLALALVDDIAVYVADLCEAGHNARAVLVAQAALDIEALI